MCPKCNMNNQKNKKSVLLDKNGVDKCIAVLYHECVLKDTTKGSDMMNAARLEYEMKCRKVSKADMCAMLGISRTAFYRKCNGKSEFTQSEIQKIAEFLELDDLVQIFFAKEVS